MLLPIRTKALKSFSSYIKIIIYSNLFVALCVTAFTHLTYIIYNLPKNNISVVLTMVFCFSFFTYNFQRYIKFRSSPEKTVALGSRLTWIVKTKNLLTILSVISGAIGLACTYFLNPLCFLILIPMGALSAFYVVPIIPFYKKSPTLREIPYLKIFVIGFVWSLIIIGLPTLNTSPLLFFKPNYLLALLQVFLFTVSITLPFDIRDIDYDKNNGLKTIPHRLGVKKTILLAEIILLASLFLLYDVNILSHHFYGLLIGHLVAMVVIAFSKKERSELFFAGLVEGLVIVLYGCVLISNYFYAL